MIYTFIHRLFEGLHRADKIAFAQASNDENDNGGSIEIKNEKDSVYKDLLKGEVTQEVRELRYEMYEAEKKSHEYEYVGGGIAKKKKQRFTDTPDIEDEEGYNIKVIQDNFEITESVSDGIDNDTVGLKNKKEYTITIEKDFFPRFRLEEYVTRLFVYEGENDKVLLKFFVSKYEKQFDRRHRPFLNEVKRIIFDNDVRSELLEINTVGFVTYKAWGANDLNTFKYGALKYRDGKETDDSYVITFTGMVIDNGIDITSEFYDPIADKKFEEKAPRKDENVMNFETAVRIIEMENDEDLKEAEEMFNNFKNDV